MDHDPAAMGITYVQARKKSQGFVPLPIKTLRFLILLKPELPRFVIFLRENHGQLAQTSDRRIVRETVEGNLTITDMNPLMALCWLHNVFDP